MEHGIHRLHFPRGKDSRIRVEILPNSSSKDNSQIDKAANLLKSEFGAEKVLVFGSLLHVSSFTLWSDIDLSASGIAAEKYYAAVAAVADLRPSARIALVDLESCRPSLRDTIYKEGVEL
jgi:predicted nucleotidyltransferase